ncbi:MAG: hypothetical protein GX442_21275 [Candidatus Riflebacteria bacterium]|nr:hypothetical protein [Candidatus Riflebacteria bacterium]
MAIPILLKILAVIVGLAVTALVILHWRTIVDWFRGRQTLVESDRANIAFSLQEKLQTGRFKTVYGVFNTRTNTLKEAEAVESAKIDHDLREVHRDSPLVIVR